MPKLICTSRYIKNPKASSAGKYLHYVGTREGVEKLANGYDSKPATKKQNDLICELIKTYPPAWNYREFEKYITEQSKGAATKFINAFINRNADKLQDVKKLVSYMAERPGVEKIGKHGYLTKKGIDNLHSIFANDIFRNEMYHLFTLQTQMRNEVEAATNQKIEELLQRSSQSAPCSENIFLLISQLSAQLKKHKGKKLYGYLQKGAKETVNSIVMELAKDKRISYFYAEWNNINRQKLSIYHNKPDPDIPLEDNKEFRSIKNAIIKAVLELNSNPDVVYYNSRVTNMVTLWARLLGGLINDSYQKKQAKLNNQIDSKLKSKIEQKKRALGIKTDHTVRDVKNDEQNFTF